MTGSAAVLLPEAPEGFSRPYTFRATIDDISKPLATLPDLFLDMETAAREQFGDEGEFVVLTSRWDADGKLVVVGELR